MCEATGIQTFAVGSQAQAEDKIVTVALGSDVTSPPERHQQYARKHVEVNATADGLPVLPNDKDLTPVGATLKIVR